MARNKRSVDRQTAAAWNIQVHIYGITRNEVARAYNVASSTVCENTKQSVRIKKNSRNKKIKELRKDFFNEYYADKSCFCCGLTDVKCFENHHLNPSQKEFNIGSEKIRKNNIGKLRQELDKCVVLCANCHRIAHWEERNGGGETWERLLAEGRRRSAINQSCKKASPGEES